MTFDQFKNRAGNLLILGPPGTAKTTIATQLPRPGIIQADGNMKGPVRYLQSHPDLKRDFRAVFPNFDEAKLGPNGEMLPQVMVAHGLRWDRMCKQAEAFYADPTIDTVVHDSMLTINDYAMDKVRVVNKKRVTTDTTPGEQISQPDWGTFYALVKHYIISTKLSPKLSVFIAHTKTDKDELGGFLKMYAAIPGQLAEQIAGLFDEVWCMAIEERGADFVRVIKTVPGLRQDALGLKTALGIGNKVDLDLKKIPLYFSPDFVPTK